MLGESREELNDELGIQLIGAMAGAKSSSA